MNEREREREKKKRKQIISIDKILRHENSHYLMHSFAVNQSTK